jgi:hypothetical protein
MTLEVHGGPLKLPGLDFFVFAEEAQFVRYKQIF